MSAWGLEDDRMKWQDCDKCEKFHLCERDDIAFLPRWLCPTCWRIWNPPIIRGAA